jgi:hypothetical protein
MMKAQKILVGNTEKKGSLVINGRIILKLIFKKRGVMMWTGFKWIRIGFISGLLRIQY